VLLAAGLWRAKTRVLGLVLLGSFALMPVIANAADKFDLWIDALTIPGFSISSVTESSSTTSTGANYSQTTLGMIGSEQVRIGIQKSGTGGGFERANTESKTRDLRSLSRYFQVDDGQGFERIVGPSLRGGQIDFRSGRCRAIQVGAHRDANAYRLVVTLLACGAAKSTISDYAKRIKPSNRDKNTADFAAFGQRESSASPPREPQIFIDCEAAKSSGRMAPFMQRSLSEQQLSQFLDANQSCEIFR
jgi:hypothetical protein